MIRRAKIEDTGALAGLAVLLWTGHTLTELEDEFAGMIEDERNAAFFILYDQGRPAGFAQCQLRYDYVEGTGSSPVGYLEGIFVNKEYRKKGNAEKLLKECEKWAREKGCCEFASDCELDNEDSRRFHIKAGFKEANRIICFTKAL